MVKDPYWPKDAANKQYVDSKSLSTGQHGNLSVQIVETGSASLHFDEDGLSLKFMMYNTVVKWVKYLMWVE